jgi:pilus assembly protein CpaB
MGSQRFAFRQQNDSDFAAPRRAGGFTVRVKRTSNEMLFAGSALLFLFLAIATIAFISVKKGRAAQNQAAKAITAPTPAPLREATFEVLVPVQDIEAGQPLHLSMMTSVWLPRSKIPLNPVRSSEEIKGMYARVPLPARQPMQRDSLTKTVSANALVANIPEGFRAVTINVTATTGVEGWARAGSYVDVNWISVDSGTPSILVIASNAKVLSAARQLFSDPNADASVPPPTTVTLLVTELDAQKISLAANAGNLVLHLRGTGDHADSPVADGALTRLNLLEGINPANETSDLQGVVQMHGADGSIEEWALLKGKLFKKQK